MEKIYKKTLINNLMGFTLVESLIYVALISICITSFVSFGLMISGIRNKNYAMEEVQVASRDVMIIFNQDLRRAQSVVEPLAGEVGSSLVLDMPGSESNISFILIDGVLYRQEGAGEQLPIISSELEITNISFTNLTSIGQRDNIKADLAIRFRSNNGVEYSFAQNIQTTLCSRY
jgi:type II secretory pathway pseudopilin PulG